MKAIDQLKDVEVLALARFISACKTSQSTRWRARLAECASRHHYASLVSANDAWILRQLADRLGVQPVCSLRTEEVLEAGRAVAGEWQVSIEGSAS